MGKWKQLGRDIHFDLEHDGECMGSCDQARRIRDAHNADGDAYEARIAELTAELAKVNAVLNITSIESEEFREQLARVKAESLRVVVEPALPNIAYDWYMTRDGELGWYGADKNGHECVETPDGYHFLGDCKPVRLERWEDEE